MAALGAARCLFLRYPRITNVHQNKHIVNKWCCVRTLCSGPADSTPADSHAKAQFTDATVQDILTKITGLDLHKVFRPLQQDIQPPSYKLMTDAQLEEANEQAKEQARKLLKMPPILPERKPIDDVLSVDTILDGTDTAKYVFTDITFNLPHRQRFIVVREPNGVLRKANWAERDRLIQVYFPKEGRKLSVPLLFNEKNLKGVFSEDRHEDVLKLCLVQFEPDSPEYIKIHKVTYEELEKQGKYHLLHSTRHFGGMAWYLVSARKADGLIVDMLQRRLLQDAVSLVSLFNMVHPNSESAQDAHAQQATGTDLLKIYAQKESQRSGFIELALQAHKETEEGSAASREHA